MTPYAIKIRLTEKNYFEIAPDAQPDHSLMELKVNVFNMFQNPILKRFLL